MRVPPLTEPVRGPPLEGPTNAGPLELPLLELLPLLLEPPELEELLPPLELPLLELDELDEVDELLPPLELPLLLLVVPLDPLDVHPSADPAGSNIPLPSAMYRLQSGNVTLPSTMG